MAKIHGEQNPADLMTKYVATDVLSRLLTHLGVYLTGLQLMRRLMLMIPDDHVAALNAHNAPPAQPCARFLSHCACVYSARNAHTARNASLDVTGLKSRRGTECMRFRLQHLNAVCKCLSV